MLEFKRRSGIVIPREYENTEWYLKVKEFLTRRTKQYNTEDYVYYIFYLETEKFLIIPRFFPLQKFIQCKITDASNTGEDISISHSITPRNSLQKNAINFMLRNKQGMIELQPGVGKTVISIVAICERRKKSIILVHRESLVEQWTNRLLQFTDIKKDQIANLRSNTFEEDLKKPIIVAMAQTVVSLLKKKRKEFLISLNEANIGMFIGDEVHTTIGAPTFSECSIHLPTMYNYGLSATPYRHDGNADIIDFHVGKTFADEDTSGTMKSRVNVMMFDFGIDIPKRYKYLNWNGNFQRSRYLNLLQKSEIFVTVVKALLSKFLGDRHILCVCERIKLIDILFDWIPTESKSKFIAGIKNEALKEKVVFSTPGKIRDGVDQKDLDLLIMTSPVSNIAQIIGRVNRELEGKPTPIVIDLIDIGCNRIKTTFYKRLQYYREKGFEVNFIFISNDYRKVIMEEPVAMSLLKGE